MELSKRIRINHKETAKGEIQSDCTVEYSADGGLTYTQVLDESIALFNQIRRLEGREEISLPDEKT